MALLKRSAMDLEKEKQVFEPIKITHDKGDPPEAV